MKRSTSAKDEKIYLSHDNGYTYGGITAYRFEEIDEEKMQIRMTVPDGLIG